MLAGPCPGAALTGKGLEIERAVRGRKRGRPRTPRLARQRSSTLPQTLYPQRSLVLGTPASIVFPGKGVISLGVNPPPKDQKSRIPLWYQEALKYFTNGKNEDLFLTCLNRFSVPLLELLSFPLPHPPLPIPGSNPSILSFPNLPGGRQQTMEIRSVASGVYRSSS